MELLEINLLIAGAICNEQRVLKTSHAICKFTLILSNMIGAPTEKKVSIWSCQFCRIGMNWDDTALCLRCILYK